MGVAYNMKKVLIRGPALSQSGYGEHTRFILRSLRSQPDLFDIYLITTNWGSTGWLWENNEERSWIDATLQKTIQHGQEGGQFDISIQVTIPNEWEKMAPVNIGVTAGIETTKIAPIWIEKSFLMDKIIVVSEHAKYGFDNTEYPATNNQTGDKFNAKVLCPIDIVGYPIKEIEPVDIDINFQHDFNFLVVATWCPRKNLPNTIKWFVEEFYDQEVGLVVKTSLAKNSLRDRIATHQRLENLLKDYGDRKCSVHLLHGDLSEEEMTGLYQHPQIKALINLAHGEGFGLPIFEAAYNALPVVSPAWGGQCDYLYMPIKDKKGKTKRSPMFTSVSFDIKPVQKEAQWEGVLQADSQWCFPIEWNYKKALREVTKNHISLKSKAKKLQAYIQEEYTPQKQYTKFVNSLGFGAEPELEIKKIGGISFCIPTNGKRIDKTNLLIRSIEQQPWRKLPYEIIISGDVEGFTKEDNIILVNKSQEAHSGKVASLRNSAFDKSQYDTVVFCDDDMLLESSWLKNTLEYSAQSGWKVLGNKILNPDGTRHWDRATFTPHVLVDYQHLSTDKNLMQTSGFFSIRREIGELVRWDETKEVYADRTGKGVPEDVQYTIDLHKENIPLSFNEASTVWHNDDRYTQFNQGTLLKETIKEHTGMEFFPPDCEEYNTLIAEV